MLRRFVRYGGVELGQIRDQKFLDVTDNLNAYVDECLLSTSVLTKDVCTNLATPQLIDSLHNVLSSQVWGTQSSHSKPESLMAGES